MPSVRRDIHASDQSGMPDQFGDRFASVQFADSHAVMPRVGHDIPVVRRDREREDPAFLTVFRFLDESTDAAMTVGFFDFQGGKNLEIANALAGSQIGYPKVEPIPGKDESHSIGGDPPGIAGSV